MGTGDGGGVGDPRGNARDTSSPLGKLLRLNPISAAPGTYQLFAYGLRNPFRFSFDRGSGDLLVGDVGQDAWEEVNRVPAGTAPPLDFGWNVCEGRQAFPDTSTPCTTGLLPVFEYAHEEGAGCSGTVIGGFVVRDPGLESLLGRYVYGDYCKHYLRSIAMPPGSGDPLPLLTAEAAVSFGEDACARVYLAQQGGAVSRLEDGSPAPCPPASTGGGPGGGSGTGEGGGGAGAGAGAAPDVTAPALTLAGPLRQRLRHRGVLVRVGCSEACRVRALAAASIPGAAHTLRFQEVLRPLAAGVVYSLRLRLWAARRRRVRSALLSGVRVRARVVVRVRDEAGNLRIGRRRVRLVL